jgi:hypothetical protein
MLGDISSSKLASMTVLAAVVLFVPTASVFAQTTNQTNTAADNSPPPSSIGTNIEQSYQGPFPSQIDRELVGPVQLLRSGEIDHDAGTITIPLYKGQVASNSTDQAAAGKTVWYILTDTDDKGNADQLGLNYAPKLTYAAPAAQMAYLNSENDTLTFKAGSVNFSPEHRLEPGTNSSNAFPPSVAEPGSVANNDYSPLIRIVNGGDFVYNAPVVAFGVDDQEISFCEGNPDHSLVHDKVVRICPEEMTVTLKLTQGFSFAKPVQYLSTEANDPVTAALENATLTPSLTKIQTGNDDGAFSAIERLFGVTNGQTGLDNPQRQGLSSAIADKTSPLNVFGGLPTVALDYSPLWDANIGEWTQEAINNHYNARVIDEFQALGLVQQGWITGPGGQPFGTSGIVINCPIVERAL